MCSGAPWEEDEKNGKSEVKKVLKVAAVEKIREPKSDLQRLQGRNRTT